MSGIVPGDIPWLAPAAARLEPLPVPELSGLPVTATPAQRLLHAHLSHGSRARREAAAFALALTQPEAAAAVRAFFNRKKVGNRGTPESK